MSKQTEGMNVPALYNASMFGATQNLREEAHRKLTAFYRRKARAKAARKARRHNRG